MPDKDKDKRPPPPQALRTFLNLSAAVPPQYGVDPTKPLLRPYVPTRGQQRAQAGLMGLADLVRGLTVGASDEKDSNAAQIGELIQTGMPLLPALGMLRGGLKIVRGAETAEEAAKTGIRAYHASPHDFDQFDISKIGTGEGAQAYGHGLYFAENPNTMEVYHHALSDDAIKFADGRIVKPEPGSVEDRALAYLATYQDGFGIDNPHRFARGEVEKLIKYGTGANRPGEMETLAKVRDQLREWEQAGVTAGKSGKRYEVNINADPEHFLDWDKPLSEQSEHVQRALSGLGGSPDDIRGAIRLYQSRLTMPGPRGEMAAKEITNLERQLAIAERRTGGEVHRDIGPDQQFAAEWLKERGVPGIRYRDQGSRGPAVVYDVGAPRPDFGPYSPFTSKAEAEKQLELLRRHGFHDAEIKTTEQPQTYNYSVFDDALINIRRKYGWLLPMMGLGALTQVGQPQEPRQ